jgi:hypothetical protein
MKHTQYVIKEINHRVRSGGLYWKQYSLQIKHCGHKELDIWYLVSETKIAEANTPRWLITNTNLAKLLLVSANNLASYSRLCNERQCIMHDDAPIYFLSEENKPIRRTRQLLWTLEGLDFIINKSRIRLMESVRSDIRVWLKAQAMAYGVHTSATPLPPESEVTGNAKIKSLEEASNNIIEVLKYVTSIVNQLWVERNKRRELEDEITRLKQHINNVSKPSKTVPLVLNNSTPKKLHIKAESKLESVRINYHKTLGLNNSLRLSLNQYLAGKGNPQKSDQLTRLGLLNSDQVYILFHTFWKDAKGKLIQKDKFQDILRDVFHTANTTHRTPCLKSDAVRDNLAIVCQVFCKKKPNPRDNGGNILELDNPAYTASPHPYVRFQARYTSKAIDYLRANWYKLLNEAVQPVTA